MENDEVPASIISLPSVGEPSKTRSSEHIRHTYTSEYYLSDCGGYVEYNRSGGKLLADERLRTIGAIASLRTSGRVLDLGCGRGELAYYFASLGHDVTGVDYSRDAIDLVHKTFGGRPDLRNRVQLICESVMNVALDGEYDIVVASDVIEHLAHDELGQLYRTIATHLSPTGIFVIHTYPNLWYLKYDYPLRRKKAALEGTSLPEQPRTSYELLMHINEQNPRLLRRQLQDNFPNVLLWFCEPSAMGGSLLRPFSRREMAAARDLFALASKFPIDCEGLRSRLESQPIRSELVRGVRLIATSGSTPVTPGEEFTLEVEIQNDSTAVLGSMPPFPVNLSYNGFSPQAKWQFETAYAPR